MTETLTYLVATVVVFVVLGAGALLAGSVLLAQTATLAPLWGLAGLPASDVLR